MWTNDPIFSRLREAAARAAAAWRALDGVHQVAPPLHNELHELAHAVADLSLLDHAAALRAKLPPYTEDDPVERAFWEFDAERRRTGAERDAFKAQARRLAAPPRRAHLIAVEGIDASGKATLVAALTKRLSEMGRGTASSFAFPAYNTPSGRLLREHLMGEWYASSGQSVKDDAIDWQAERHQGDLMVRQALMIVNRHELQPEIEAALLRGPVVLDRWEESSHTHGAVEGVDPQWTRRASATLLKPDLNLLLDVDPAVSMRRRAARDLNECDAAKLRAVREVYRARWENARAAGSPLCWVTIDASQSAEAVLADALSAYCHFANASYGRFAGQELDAASEPRPGGGSRATVPITSGEALSRLAGDPTDPSDPIVRHFAAVDAARDGHGRTIDRPAVVYAPLDDSPEANAAAKAAAERGK